MKKLVFIAIFIVFCISENKAQFNSPDAKGKSSMLNQPSSIGVDLEDSKLNLEFNNIYGQHSRNFKVLYGIKYKGGAEDGISQLFNKSDFVFGNEMSSFLGLSFMTKPGDEKKWDKKIDSISTLRAEITSIHKKLIADTINYFFTSTLSKLDEEKKKSLFVYIYDTDDTSSVASIYDLDFEAKVKDKQIQHFFESIELKDTVYQKKIKQHLKILKQIVDSAIYKQSLLDFSDSYLHKKRNEIRTDSWKKARITFFLNGGLSGHNFKMINTMDLGLITKKMEFRGGHFGVGANIRLRGKHYIGLLYNVEWIDNFSDLDKNTYFLSKKDTIEGSIYDSKTEMIAYSGDYVKYQKHTLGIDFVNQFSFSDFSKIALNLPYVRYNSYSGLEDSANTLDIGISANFYKAKGRFLFGLFVELEDLTNENNSDRKELNRLTAGFRLNYALFTQLSR